MMLKAYHRWLMKRRIRKARRLLAAIDRGVKRVGMPRATRKQMWRDFVKSKSGHDAILDLIEVK